MLLPPEQQSSLPHATQALAVRVTILRSVLSCICIHSLVSIFIMQPQNPYHNHFVIYKQQFMSWYCKDDVCFMSTPTHWMRYLHSWQTNEYTWCKHGRGLTSELFISSWSYKQAFVSTTLWICAYDNAVCSVLFPLSLQCMLWCQSSHRVSPFLTPLKTLQHTT